MNLIKKHPVNAAIIIGFSVFAISSLLAGFEPGQAIGKNFLQFAGGMLKVLPCIFILIGLFNVWVKKETIEKHLGHGSGPLSYFWAMLLASSTVGGFHVALPIADELRNKGARLSVVLTFLSAAGVCRIPMTLFEAMFLGWRFTCVRFLVSVPLVIISSTVLAKWFEKRGYQLPIQSNNG